MSLLLWIDLEEWGLRLLTGFEDLVEVDRLICF